jgi:hypothetical protein
MEQIHIDQKYDMNRIIASVSREDDYSIVFSLALPVLKPMISI